MPRQRCRSPAIHLVVLILAALHPRGALAQRGQKSPSPPDIAASTPHDTQTSAPTDVTAPESSAGAAPDQGPARSTTRHRDERVPGGGKEADGPEAALLSRIHLLKSTGGALELARAIGVARINGRLRTALVHVLAEHLIEVTGDVASVRRTLAQTPLPEITRHLLGLPPSQPVVVHPAPSFEGETDQWRHLSASAKARNWSRRPLLLLLVLDGLRAELLDDLLDRGEMPVVRSELVNRGMIVDRMISCFPTVTSPNAATMLTGVFPDRHRIPALAWYDKDRRTARLYTSVAGRALNRDMPREVRSLWEWLHDDYTVSTLGVPLERGAQKRWFQLFYPASWLTRLARGYLRPGPRPFAVCVWYAHTDTTAHLSGALSDAEQRAVKDFDTQLGRLVATLKGRGLYDRTILVLASDHGMAPTIIDRDLAGHLRRQGIPIRGLNLSVDPFLPSAMHRRLRHAKAVAINVGAGSTSLYLDALKDGQDCESLLHAYPTRRGNVDLLARIFDVGAVDLVLHRRADDAVVVEGRHGRGLVRMRRLGGHALARYDALSGDDPLHVPASLRGFEIPARRFILETASTPYPGAVPNIGAAMASARLGDIVITSRMGYNFSKNFHSRGGYHGGLSASEAVTHFMLAGPGVPHTRVAAASMADVTPTLLSLLGIAYDPAIFDGRALIEKH